jgi:hypothetical protein
MFLVTELCASSLDLYTGAQDKKEEAISKGMPVMCEVLLLQILIDVREKDASQSLNPSHAYM